MAEPTADDGVKSTVCSERNTIGSEAVKLAQKQDEKIEGLELAKEETKSYMEEVYKCARDFPANDGKTPFYICITQTKKAKLVNVIHRRFFARSTIPAPTPATTVFKYFPVSHNAQLLWSLPNEQAINWFVENWNNVPLDYLPIKKTIAKYLSGELHQLIVKEDPSLAQIVYG